MEDKNKDYLVILAGSPRGGEQTWKTLYKYVLKPLDADLALCCSDVWDQDISLFKIAKYKWIFKEYEDYNDYYEERFDGSWKEFFNKGRETGLYSSGMLQFAKKDILKNDYLDIIKEYKYIIYTRFDQFYIKDHPKIISDKIMIPEGEDYFGLCDRHASFPSKYAEDFFNICSYINTKEALEAVNKINNSESTFLNHLKKEGLLQYVKRHKRYQFTVNLKGEHTNWRTSVYRLYLYKNMMIKYPNEFIVSMKNYLESKSFSITHLYLLLNYFYLESRRTIGKIKTKILNV